MKASLFLVPSVFVGALLACGGSTTSGSGANGGNSVSGTVAGVTLQASSVIAALGSSSTSGGCAVEPDGGLGDCTTGTYVQEVNVVFTNRADVTCSAIQALAAQNLNVEFANIDYLSVGVNVNGGIVPGTYDVVAGPTNGAVTGAFGGLSGTNATCVEAPNLAATGGTVTITAFDGSHVAGSYDLTFGAKGSASGAFNQSICAVPEGTTTTGAPVCR